MDGVLVDSESLAWDAWRAVLSPFGIEVTDHDIVTVTGRTFADGYAHFAVQGLPDRDQVAALLEAEIALRFVRSLEAFEDAYDTVEVLHDRGVGMAVATSSPRSRLDRSLESVGMADWFRATAAGDEVQRGKPAPEVYLLAAERLGVDAASCIAVEDTQVGIDAARAAGMFVVGVQRGETILQADAIVPRLIPAVLLRES